MIPRKLRLPPKAFPRRAERTVASPLFTAKISKNTLFHNRFAVVVGKAVEKRAVYRNRIRRSILNAARTWPNMHADILFIVLKKAAVAPRAEFREELEKVCEELDIYIWEHSLCDTCGKTIRGSFTINLKGNLCYECENKTKDT